MRHSNKIFTPAVAMCFASVMCFVLSACQPKDEEKVFHLSETEIFASSEGVSADVKITSSDDWIASTNVSWIAVSPANGRGSVDCKINVDTTAMYGSVRTAIVRFESVKDGTSLSLRVEQYGYEKFILVSKKEVSVPEYAETDKRLFDVEITSNVKFDINATGSGNWVSYDPFDFELDRGARPRRVNVRFRYSNNTRPDDRTCEVTFSASDLSQLARSESITVIQKKAPPIENNRRGDSLAIIAIARAIGYDMGTSEGERMDRWGFVSLWNINDEGYTPELEGRLRRVEFRSFRTWLDIKNFANSDELPYEFHYLNTVEDLILYANDNKLLISLGTSEIGSMTRLKRLTIYSVGLNRLNDDFINLTNLEYLDLSGNNFNEVPAMLTPENFPKLKHLDLSNNKRFTIIDLSNTPRLQSQWGGLYGSGVFPAQLLEWENLEYLSLGNNYVHGEIPDMSDYVKYEAGDEYISARGDTITPAIGLPRVWPKMRALRLNLNYMSGNIPDWLLYHPKLDTWDPQTLVFHQNDSNLLDVNGQVAGFDNVPASDQYYYDRYPLLNPDN